MKDKVCVFLLVAVLAITMIMGIAYKPSIETATFEQLMETDGIAEYYAEKIIVYCEENEQVKVGDLISIPGIGPVIIRELEERWK